MFKKKGKKIYMDYASGAPVNEKVVKAMEPYWKEKFANPSEKHSPGRENRNVIERCRDDVAGFLNAKSDEIIFTSSGTEANNLALLGFFNFIRKEVGTLNGYHAITSEIEHSSVLKIFKYLEKDGLEVSYAKVDENGILDLKSFKSLLKENTILISVMFVNNEIGTIQPIEEISKTLRSFRRGNRERILFPNLELPVFHTDVSQAPLFLDLDTKKIGVDLLTIDGQKIYGPKGVGVLFKKKEISLDPIMFGGGQEGGLKPGTENVPLIVGMAEAVKLSNHQIIKSYNHKIKELHDYFIDRILKEIPSSTLNGDRKNKTPHIINISFKDVNHEFLATQLDKEGIYVSTKSACLSKEEEGSYVLRVMGKNNTGAIRFSLGKSTTKKDVNYVVDTLKKLV